MSNHQRGASASSPHQCAGAHIQHALRLAAPYTTTRPAAQEFFSVRSTLNEGRFSFVIAHLADRVLRHLLFDRQGGGPRL